MHCWLYPSKFVTPRPFWCFFVNPQHLSNTSITTNWWTISKHTYNVFGNHKLSLLWTYQMTCDPIFHVAQDSWFCLIDCTLIRYARTAFCRIEWSRNFLMIACWMEGSKSLISSRAIVASFLAILAITFCNCLS